MQHEAFAHTEDFGGPDIVAVTGRTVGPPLYEAMELLGCDETLRRLRTLPGGPHVA